MVRDEFSKYDLEADDVKSQVLFSTGAVLSHTILIVILQIASEHVTDDEAVDFFDIPMDGIAQPHELDDYLSQPIEKVRDPIAWWWDHRHIFPKLSKMAFDYLSIPGMCRACQWSRAY
jgi:hypothetical protein